MFKGVISTFIIITAIVLLLGGCVSAPQPGVIPTPTAEPTSPLPATALPVTATPTAAPFVTPEITVTVYPASVNGDTNITIDWEVSGGSTGEISQTAVYWGYKTAGANTSDYPRASTVQTGKAPQGFSTIIKAPAGGDFYFRAHATVDGIDVYSPEYRITIIAPMGGGGGY